MARKFNHKRLRYHFEMNSADLRVGATQSLSTSLKCRCYVTFATSRNFFGRESCSFEAIQEECHAVLSGGANNKVYKSVFSNHMGACYGTSV